MQHVISTSPPKALLFAGAMLGAGALARRAEAPPPTSKQA